jgi:hypothetical protein
LKTPRRAGAQELEHILSPEIKTGSGLPAEPFAQKEFRL